jgi:uncharacterized cupin superfamily protein
VSNYSICKVEDVPDFFGGVYPGEMRFLGMALGTEQISFTYRRMPEGTGGKGSYGHKHKTQEELYFLISGRLEAKLDDEVVELGPGTALRVAPEVARSLWNEGPEDAHLVIVSVRVDDPEADVGIVDDFWPAE